MIRVAIAILLLAAYLLTGPAAIWNNQMGQWGAGALPVSGRFAIDFLFLAGFFALAFRYLEKANRRVLPVFLALSLVAGQIACLRSAWPFITQTPQGIDHPAFLFRIREFIQVFPFALGSYNPWWNGGTEHFIGVTSGSHNFGILLLPFLAFGELERVYAPALFAWLFLFGPWLGVLSMRLAGCRWTGALPAGLLLCAFTRAEYLFFWQSGNLGGMVAALLTLPFLALGYRLAVQRRGGWGTALSLSVLAWLMSIWSPGALTGIGMAAGWLWCRRRWTRRSVLLALAAAAFALILLSPWLWVTLFPARAIVDYVAAGESGSFASMLRSGLQQLFRRIQEWHPVILVLGTAGLFLPGMRNLRRWTLPTLCLLATIAASVGFKRQSQLDRVAIQMAAAAAFPASIACGRILSRPLRFKSRTGSWFVAASRGILCAALVLGLRVAAVHAGNGAGFKLWPAEPVVYEFSNWIRGHVPPEGRLAFAGETDCKYDWGKPAYFPILANREMMSCDYYGFPAGLTERNYPPRRYRRSTEDVLFFQRAYGITHWSVTDKDRRLRRFFTEETNHYALAATFQMQSSRIEIYAATDAPPASRLYEGAGRVDVRENHIAVRPENPTAERLVLRYNWRPGLRCLTAGAEIGPFPVDENITFIAVRPHGNPCVEIGYRPTWRPLQPNFDGSFHH